MFTNMDIPLQADGGGTKKLQEFLDNTNFCLKTYASDDGYSQFASFDVSDYSEVKVKVATPSPAYYVPYYKLDSGSWTSMGGYDREVTINVSSATTLYLGIYNHNNTYLMNIPIAEFVAK